MLHHDAVGFQKDNPLDGQLETIYPTIDPVERLKTLVKAAERYQHCGCAGIELFKEVEAAKNAINAAERRQPHESIQ